MVLSEVAVCVPGLALLSVIHLASYQILLLSH